MIELAALFAFGWFFWIIALITLAAMFFSVSMHSLKITSLIAVIGAALLMWRADFDPFAWASSHVTELLIGVLIYLAAGVVVSTVKWVSYLKKISRALVEFRAREKIAAGTALTDKQVQEFYNFHRSVMKRPALPPKVSQHKEFITLWMMFWPVTALVTLLEDFLQEIYLALYNFVAGFFQSISNRIFKGLV